MLKQIIALFLLSIIVILCMPYIQQGLEWIVAGHNWVSDGLTAVFSGSKAGDLIRKLLALLAIPFFVGLLPVVVYWFAKKNFFPYFMQIVWIVWLMEVAALIVQYKAATAS